MCSLVKLVFLVSWFIYSYLGLYFDVGLKETSLVPHICVRYREVSTIKCVILQVNYHCCVSSIPENGVCYMGLSAVKDVLTLLWKLFLCNLYQGAFGMVNEFSISVTDKKFVGGFVQELNNITSRLHHNCVTLLSHDCITEHRNHIVSAPYHYIDLHKLFHHNWVILHPHCISTSMSISIAI